MAEYRSRSGKLKSSLYQLGSCWSVERTTSSNRGSDQEHVVLLTSEQEQAKEVIDANKREIENIEIHGVYECMLDNGQKCLSTRWVIMEKLKDKWKIMKAHLVAGGYEEDSHNLKTDSLTCSPEAVYCNVNSLSYEVAGRESGFYLSISAGW